MISPRHRQVNDIFYCIASVWLAGGAGRHGDFASESRESAVLLHCRAPGMEARSYDRSDHARGAEHVDVSARIPPHPAGSRRYAGRLRGKTGRRRIRIRSFSAVAPNCSVPPARETMSRATTCGSEKLSSRVSTGVTQQSTPENFPIQWDCGFDAKIAAVCSLPQFASRVALFPMAILEIRSSKHIADPFPEFPFERADRHVAAVGVR